MSLEIHWYTNEIKLNGLWTQCYAKQFGKTIKIIEILGFRRSNRYRFTKVNYDLGTEEGLEQFEIDFRYLKYNCLRLDKPKEDSKKF